METIANIFIILVAVLHLYFCYLEMFLWTTPKGLATFKMSEEKARHSSVLAANQGLYNALLALGLLGSFFLDPPSAFAIRCYILLFITVVGIYGWYSLHSFRVFIIQALPAIIALAILLVG